MRVLPLVLVLVLLVTACAGGGHTVAGSVPERYRSAYAELTASLTQFEATLRPGPPELASIGAISTSLVLANSNNGERLLRPGVLAAIHTYLDRITEMGTTAIEIQIAYPVASADHPDREAYLDFYRKVMVDARRHGMKVLIETSCIFADSPFSDVRFDFGRLTPAAYFAARTAQLVTIATELRPDYLAIGVEPVNERVFARIAYSTEEYVAFVNGAATAIRAAVGRAVKVGAGTGTWEAELHADLVARTSLDFYDIHVYPLQGTPRGLEQARVMARLAQAKGADAIIGETWLYKLTRAEIGATSGASAAEAFRRDAFSFWEALDERYIADVLALAAELRSPFVSFWGARFFFADLAWTPELDRLDFREVSAAVNPQIVASLTAGRRTALGDAFAKRLGR